MKERREFKYVNELESKTYVFDRKWKVAAELDRLSLHDIVSFFDYYISKGAVERKKISIRIVGKVVAKESDAKGDDKTNDSNNKKEEEGNNDGNNKSGQETTSSSTSSTAATTTVVEEATLSYGTLTENGETIIKDLDQFKRSMCLYPVEASYSIQNANAKNMLPN